MGVMSDKSDMCMKVQGRFTCHKLVHDGLLNMYISVAGFRPTVYETQTEVFDFGVDGDGRERGRFVVRWEEGREREGRVEGENEEGGGGDGLLIGRGGGGRKVKNTDEKTEPEQGWEFIKEKTKTRKKENTHAFTQTRTKTR